MSKKWAMGIVLGVLLWSMPCSGQQEAIDRGNRAAWAVAISHPDSAIALSKSLISEAERIDYTKGRAQAISQLGAALDIKGESTIGLGHLLEALAIQREIGDSIGLAFTYSNLGFLHYVRNDYGPAADFFSKCLAIEEQVSERGDVAGTKINLGLMQGHLGQTAASERSFQEALADFASVGDTLGMITARHNLSTRYLDQGRYEEALTTFSANEADMLRLGADTERLSSLYYSMTEANLGLDDLDEALSYAQRNLEVCQAEGMIQRRQYAHESLEKVYRRMGDYPKAHHHLSRYSQLRDSLYMVEQNESLRRMETDFELLESEQERAQAEWQATAAAKESRAYRLIALSLAGLLLALGVIVWLYQANKRKDALLMSERVDAAEARLQEKELLLGEMHHRVKNNLQLVHSIVEMQSESARSPEATEALGDASQRIAAISRLHHFLYDNEEVRAVDISDYLCSLLDTLLRASSPDERSIDLQTDIAPLRLDVETAIPIGLICNELVTNALKHGLPSAVSPQVRVTLQEADDLLHLCISDNGQSSSRVAAGREGYGSRIVRVLSKQLRADWRTDTTEGYAHQLIITHYTRHGDS